MMTTLDMELYKVHQLYHLYREFNNSSFTDLDDAENRLNEIINNFRISGIKEFEGLASTLSN